jgi:hypothetical protein
MSWARKLCPGSSSRLAAANQQGCRKPAGLPHRTKCFTWLPCGFLNKLVRMPLSLFGGLSSVMFVGRGSMSRPILCIRATNGDSKCTNNTHELVRAAAFRSNRVNIAVITSVGAVELTRPSHPAARLTKTSPCFSCTPIRSVPRLSTQLLMSDAQLFESVAVAAHAMCLSLSTVLVQAKQFLSWHREFGKPYYFATQ